MNSIVHYTSSIHNQDDQNMVMLGCMFCIQLIFLLLDVKVRYVDQHELQPKIK